MELKEAVKTRRSIREYKEEQIPENVVRELIEMATWAPSGMNSQPWLFSVIQDRQLLETISRTSKAALLDHMDKIPAFQNYKETFSDPSYDIFYQAPTLVLIYGDSKALTSHSDCSMAALNLMLAAWDQGIGSCWIGFAYFVGNSPEMKRQLAVPEGYELVAPIILGYPAKGVPPRERSAPNIVSWLK